MENPVGAQVIWTVRDRIYLADVVGVYRDPVLGVIMLKVQHFNGEPAPDVAASIVKVLVRTYDNGEEN